MKTEKMNSTNDENTVLKSFLSEKQILVVDSSKSFSSMIHRTLKGAGVPGKNIKIVTDGNLAFEFIDEIKPQVIITEYIVGQTNGLSFTPIQQKLWPISRERIFVLITSSSAESSIVEAVEGEVDGYLLKPFSASHFLGAMEKIIQQKRHPSKYLLMLEATKQLIAQNELPKAEQLAASAITLSDKPCMAYVLMAKIYQLKNDLPAALECFGKGLEHNNAHYKCLKGKFDLLEQMEKHVEAYEALKFFFDQFPFKGMMLKKAFYLAIRTGNEDDLSHYYEVFKTLEDRSSELVQEVCARLFEAGEIKLVKNQNRSALEFFNWAAISSGRDPILIEKVVRKLAAKGFCEDAEKVFKLYPIDAVGTPVYHRLNFMLAAFALPSHQVVERGRQIIAQGNANEEVYLEIIKHCTLMERTMAAENIAYEAANKFPDDRENFLKAAGIN